MSKRFIVATSFLLMAACAAPDIQSPPLPVTPTNQANAIGLDVYGRDRQRGASVPRFRGQTTVAVRAFGKLEDSRYGELPGATCTADSGVYKASFQAPANIVVPNYGPNSPAIFVKCSAQTISGSTTANAVNLTSQQRMSGAGAGGLLGVVIVSAIDAAKRDDSKDAFGYSPIRVEMK